VFFFQGHPIPCPWDTFFYAASRETPGKSTSGTELFSSLKPRSNTWRVFLHEARLFFLAP